MHIIILQLNKFFPTRHYFLALNKSVINPFIFGAFHIIRMIKILSHFFHISRLRDYRLYIKNIQQDYQPNSENSLCIIPNFDHSPRSHRRGVIYYNSSPKLWGNLLYYLKNELHLKN